MDNPTSASDPTPTPDAAPRRRRWLRRSGIPLALITTAALVGLAQQSAPAQSSTTRATGHRTTPQTRLVCSGSISGTSSKPISDTPQSVTASGTGTIDKCFVKNGGPTNLVSGTVTFNGTSPNATCTGLTNYTGTAVITWYSQANQQGTPVGTSTINTSSGQSGEGDPSAEEVDTDANATVTDGSAVMAGYTAEGAPFPSTDISQCSALPSTLSSASGKFAVQFSVPAIII